MRTRRKLWEDKRGGGGLNAKGFVRSLLCPARLHYVCLNNQYLHVSEEGGGGI